MRYIKLFCVSYYTYYDEVLLFWTLPEKLSPFLLFSSGSPVQTSHRLQTDPIGGKLALQKSVTAFLQYSRRIWQSYQQPSLTTSQWPLTNSKKIVRSGSCTMPPLLTQTEKEISFSVRLFNSKETTSKTVFS